MLKNSKTSIQMAGESEREEKTDSPGCPRRRLLLFPSPLQGHITPMLHLATLLHSRSFLITIIHTTFNSPDPSHHPNFTFQPISDGLPETTDPSGDDFVNLAAALNSNCEAPFRECLERLLTEEREDERIVGVVDDGVMAFVQEVAKDLKIARVMFIINSAASLWTYAAFPLLGEKGYFPIQDPASKSPITELPPLRIKDLPDIPSQDPDAWFQIVAKGLHQINSSSAIFWNTFHSLEHPSLHKMSKTFPHLPMFTIGPLHRFSPTTPSTSLFPQDRTCMSWLDCQPPHSVVYVSFGSLASMSSESLAETAWGLARSMQRFLWVVRRGSVRGSSAIQLPDGFEEETKGRGLVVGWVPQREVLAHPAVGGFWTHCGWNSTLESICEGVPMLCWPSFGDQRVNARFVSHVWRVGHQLEDGLERGEIERALKRLMVERESDEVRERAKDLKRDAEVCLKEGGSSYESLNRMVEYILSL